VRGASVPFPSALVHSVLRHSEIDLWVLHYGLNLCFSHKEKLPTMAALELGAIFSWRTESCRGSHLDSVWPVTVGDKMEPPRASIYVIRILLLPPCQVPLLSLGCSLICKRSLRKPLKESLGPQEVRLFPGGAWEAAGAAGAT
jgi:hypothetical protein